LFVVSWKNGGFTNNEERTTNNSPTIAVFDSGFGGLTVLRALLPLIPGADYIYLGDTARLPYGAKSRETIVRYALSSAAFLLAQGAQMLVVACNTASALALDELKAALPIPVIGVIEPGVQAASALFPTPSSLFPASVLVLATSATVQSHAYAQACAALELAAYEKACPLLVPLVEEGWIDHSVTAEVLRIYLAEALAEAPAATTLVLGCTHYPLLKPMIERTLIDLKHPLHIIDSATATAHAALNHIPAWLSSRSEAEGSAVPPSTTTFYATDSVEKFQRLGSAFLGQPLPAVRLIDLGG
jgi:glutamate racemase